MFELNPHFRSWVPKWLSIVIAMLILFPVLLINGAYTGSNVDISSALGVLSEDINMAYYTASAGMAIGYLFLPYVKPIATTKTIILSVLLIQIALSLICALTSYIEIVIVCSFAIGFFKAFSMSEVITILMPFFSPSDTRNEFYSKFYPITIGIAQLSLVLTAEFAYRYQWQHMYYFMIVLLLIAVIAVVIFMRYGGRLIRIPFKEIDWLSFFQLSVVMLSVIYVLNYGKINDWFTSPKIVLFSIVSVVLGWIFVRRQLLAERPFVNLNVLRNRSSRVVYLLSFLLMFFASYTVLTSSYVNTILRIDSVKSNELYLYTLPGLVVGGIICFYFFKQAIRMAWLIFLGFGSFTIAIAYLYFTVEPMGLYSDLFLPMFLKGVGMVILFVAFGVYAVQGLSAEQLLPNIFFIIGTRSALAPAVGTTILVNWLYRLQQKNMTVLSENISFDNPLAVNQFTSSLQSAVAKGYGIQDAEKIATNALYLKVQIQAMTVSIKTILGWMLILGILVMVGILLYFFKYSPVKLMKAGTDMH